MLSLIEILQDAECRKAIDELCNSSQFYPGIKFVDWRGKPTNVRSEVYYVNYELSIHNIFRDQSIIGLFESFFKKVGVYIAGIEMQYSDVIDQDRGDLLRILHMDYRSEAGKRMFEILADAMFFARFGYDPSPYGCYMFSGIKSDDDYDDIDISKINEAVQKKCLRNGIKIRCEASKIDPNKMCYFPEDAESASKLRELMALMPRFNARHKNLE